MNHLASSSDARMRPTLADAAVSRARRGAVSAVAFVLAMVCAVPLGLADRVDGKLEAAVHLKVLGYDRGLKKRGNPTKLVIGVLYIPGGDSEKVEKEMVAAFRDMAKQLKIQGLPVDVVAIPY